MASGSEALGHYSVIWDPSKGKLGVRIHADPKAPSHTIVEHVNADACKDVFARGVQPGDRIVKVGNNDVTAVGVTEVFSILRQHAQAPVTIEFERAATWRDPSKHQTHGSTEGSPGRNQPKPRSAYTLLCCGADFAKGVTLRVSSAGNLKVVSVSSHAEKIFDVIGVGDSLVSLNGLDLSGTSLREFFQLCDHPAEVLLTLQACASDAGNLCLSAGDIQERLRPTRNRRATSQPNLLQVLENIPVGSPVLAKSSISEGISSQGKNQKSLTYRFLVDRGEHQQMLKYANASNGLINGPSRKKPILTDIVRIS